MSRRDRYWKEWIAARSPEIKGNKIEAYKHMFDDFRSVQRNLKERSFYEILGNYHYENTISRVLAYLFDDDEDHGFGTLFIRTWLEVTGTSDRYDYRIEYVEREYRLPDGTRIDLLIVMSDQVIIIENKIQASVYNPLKGYYQQIQILFPGKEVKLYVLSMDQFAYQLGSFDLVNYVTYQSWLEVVEKRIGNYLLQANSQRLPQLLDYLKTLKKMANNKYVDSSFAEFCYDNKEVINAFLLHIDKETSSLTNLLEAVKRDLGKLGIVLDVWRDMALFANLAMDDGGELSFDVLFNLTGIEITLWERTPSRNSQKILNSPDYREIIKYPNEQRRILVQGNDLRITADINKIVAIIERFYVKITSQIDGLTR